jgi:hypothetical protein
MRLQHQLQQCNRANLFTHLALNILLRCASTSTLQERNSCVWPAEKTEIELEGHRKLEHEMKGP